MISLEDFRICVLVDGYRDIGYGHILRCINLLSALEVCKKQVLIISICDNECEKILKNSHYEYKRYFIEDGLNYDAYISFISNYPNIKAVITDVAYYLPNENTKNLESLHIFLSKFYKLIILDGYWKYSFRKYFKNLNCDLLIAPYVGERSNYGGIKAFQEFVGPEYFIANNFYRSAKYKRKFSRGDNKILITCGGTDPNNITKEILSILMQSTVTYKIRITIGQGYDLKAVLSIEELAHKSNHIIDFIKSQNNLTEQFEWADIAITSGGLTKYELACMGVPTVCVATNEEHLEGNSEFSRLGASISLNLLDKNISFRLNDIVYKLLKNDDQRIGLSQSGRRRFSTKKLSSLLDAIRGLVAT